MDGGAIDIVQPDCEELRRANRVDAHRRLRIGPIVSKVSPHGTHLTAAHAVADTENATAVEGLEELFRVAARK